MSTTVIVWQDQEFQIKFEFATGTYYRCENGNVVKSSQSFSDMFSA